MHFFKFFQIFSPPEAKKMGKKIFSAKNAKNHDVITLEAFLGKNDFFRFLRFFFKILKGPDRAILTRIF